MINTFEEPFIKEENWAKSTEALDQASAEPSNSHPLQGINALEFRYLDYFDRLSDVPYKFDNELMPGELNTKEVLENSMGYIRSITYPHSSIQDACLRTALVTNFPKHFGEQQQELAPMTVQLETSDEAMCKLYTRVQKYLSGVIEFEDEDTTTPPQGIMGDIALFTYLLVTISSNCYQISAAEAAGMRIPTKHWTDLYDQYSQIYKQLSVLSIYPTHMRLLLGLIESQIERIEPYRVG